MKAKVLAIVAALFLAGSLTVNAQPTVYAGYSHLMYGDVSAPGFAVGGDYAFNLLSNVPLKLMAGARFNFNTATEKVVGQEVKGTYMALDIPVTAGYEFPLGLGLSLMPYMGLDALYFVSAKASGVGLTTNLLSKDEWGDGAMKPFQVGASLGLRMLYEHFMLGVEYRPYFTDINADNKKPSFFAFNVGWAF